MKIDNDFKKALNTEINKKFGKDFGKYYVKYRIKDDEDGYYPIGEVIELKNGKVKTTVFKGYLDLPGKRYLWHEKTSADLKNAINYMKKIHKDVHSLIFGLYEEWFDEEMTNFTFYKFDE